MIMIADDMCRICGGTGWSIGKDRSKYIKTGIASFKIEKCGCTILIDIKQARFE